MRTLSARCMAASRRGAYCTVQAQEEALVARGSLRKERQEHRASPKRALDPLAPCRHERQGGVLPVTPGAAHAALPIVVARGTWCGRGRPRVRRQCLSSALVDESSPSPSLLVYYPRPAQSSWGSTTPPPRARTSPNVLPAPPTPSVPFRAMPPPAHRDRRGVWAASERIATLCAQRWGLPGIAGERSHPSAHVATCPRKPHSLIGHRATHDRGGATVTPATELFTRDGSGAVASPPSRRCNRTAVRFSARIRRNAREIIRYGS